MKEEGQPHVSLAVANKTSMDVVLPMTNRNPKKLCCCLIHPTNIGYPCLILHLTPFHFALLSF